METFSTLLALCEGNSPVTGEFPSQRPVTKKGFDVFFDLRLNKRLSKPSWGWWFETPSRSVWRHCNSDALFNGCHLLQSLITSIPALMLPSRYFNGYCFNTLNVIARCFFTNNITYFNVTSINCIDVNQIYALDKSVISTEWPTLSWISYYLPKLTSESGISRITIITSWHSHQLHIYAIN